MNRLKKNDTVMVISGRDKGKIGSIVKILPSSEKVLVQGIALATKHMKAKKQGDVSGIKKVEMFINASKLMPSCGSCGKPTRVGSKVVDNKRVRMCLKCKEVF